jgi:hypothetical protein
MIPLTVNDEVAGILGGYVDAVEVRDEQGRVLGHFLPYLTPETRDVYAHPEAYLDLEELRRLAEDNKSEPGRPLAEILRRLESAEPQK